MTDKGKAASAPNADQATYWNEQGGPRWVAMESALDAQLEPFGVAVATKLGLAAGERVLDVGCGGGATSLMLAERVRPGQVVGVDISAPLLARARQRAAGIANLRFEDADAQSFAFPAGSYDAIFSRCLFKPRFRSCRSRLRRRGLARRARSRSRRRGGSRKFWSAPATPTSTWPGTTRR